MAEDKKYGRIKITWDYPKADPDAYVYSTWATANTKYFVTIEEFRGGPKRVYQLWHPTNFLYAYVSWGAKFHVEVWAADANNNRACRILSKDLNAREKPANATADLDYPSKNRITGMNPEGEWITYTVTFPVTDPLEWMNCETILEGSPTDGSDPHEGVPYYVVNGFSIGLMQTDFAGFDADLPVGTAIHQTSKIQYEGGVFVTVQKDFVVGNQ